MSASDKSLLLLHFNDVYNITSRTKEPVGGASRLATKIKSFQPQNPLVFFSGDAFNPSAMSGVFAGEQMVPCLNAMGIHAAVYGNHDFDFGVDDLLHFKKESSYPWLMSNVIDNTTKKPLGDGGITVKLESNGHKIGCIGLVEKDWLETLGAVDVDQVTYKDFISEGERLSKKLRDEGCDFIIAITHMRLPNDQLLAEKVSGIDIVLGGHDHDYGIFDVNGKKVIKSGTDFRNMSEIEITFADGSFSVKTTRHDITSDVPEDPEVKAIVESFTSQIDQKMQIVLGQLAVDLDALFSHLRTQETNMGNFISDIMSFATRADIALLNSGTLRSDRIHPIGPFKVQDLVTLLPFTPSTVVTLGITGTQLLAALENGVSKYPEHEGRFPQISGMEFTFDPSKSEGQRVIANSVKIGGEDLVMEKKYSLATTSYAADGNDGYDIFLKCDVMVDEENGPELRTIVRNHFIVCSLISGVKKALSAHMQSVVRVLSGENRAEKQKESLGVIDPKVEGRIKIIQ